MDKTFGKCGKRGYGIVKMIFQHIVNDTFFPLGREPGKAMIGNRTLEDIISGCFTGFPDDLIWRSDYLPDKTALHRLTGKSNFTAVAPDGTITGTAGTGSEIIPVSGVRAVYPWDLLEITQLLAGNIEVNDIQGSISCRAEIEGKIILGKNSRLLPGVYIEGNCVIGENCKIGPNCYLRGNTFIGDNCHIGQAVEVKNCIIGNRTSLGHLSYAGDSVIGSRVNFGAGTIIANLRHDGKNHRSMVNGSLVDTGRRKFGAVIGDDVHTGIHTAIYCGRKIAAGSETAPGTVVKNDL